MKIKTENPAEYNVKGIARTVESENEIIERALYILQSRLRMPGAAMTDPQTVKDYLTRHLATRDRETFVALWLDTQNRLIETEELFTGTLSQCAVYPREVVKRALHHNAGAVIFAHNHPSGFAEPSQADRQLTATLKQTLALVDVKVLDHVIIGGMRSFSFAEMGEI